MEISRNADITIANGESLSNAIDLNDRGLCALLMPAAWRAAKTNIPAQTCATSTRTQFGVLTLPDSDGKYTAQFSEKLPSNWTGAIDLNIQHSAVTDNNASHNVVFQVQTACVADGETSEPSWNSPNSVSDAIKVTILQQNDAAMTSITTTGCSAVETLFIGIFRKRIHASDSATGEIRLHGVEIVTRGTIL